MTPDEIRTLIENDIAGDWLRSNRHGCDLRRCLVVPELREYDDCGTPPSIVRMWLLLEENPDDRSGYKIVYSDQAGLFGLAVPGSARDVFIGYYGTFLETFAGM